MIEKLTGAVAEVGKTAAEGFEKVFDPDKRVDVQKELREPDAQSKEIDLDKRLDSQGPKLNDNGELQPNQTFELNGYEYSTDNKGRVVSAEGVIHLKETGGRESIKPSLEDIGKGDERPGDERGHIVADRFNGSGDIANFTAQDANINRSDVKCLENDLAKGVNDGKEVFMRVDIAYSKGSHRPSEYRYTYTIGGEPGMRVFKNGAA